MQRGLEPEGGGAVVVVVVAVRAREETVSVSGALSLIRKDLHFLHFLKRE